MIALILLIPAGILLGILINYLADVLPYTRRFSAPLCGRCGERMGWGEYITRPICEHCHQPRRMRHWLLPVLGAILVSLFWFYPPVHIGFWIAVILLAYFTLVAITDIEYHAILDQVTVAGVIIGFGTGLARHIYIDQQAPLDALKETVLGGVAAFGAMLLMFYLGILFGRMIARRRGVVIEDGDALGFGDVYLTGILGLILGWPAVVAGLFAGIMIGGLVGVVYLLYGAIKKRPRGLTYLPYAPFLLLGAILILYPPW